MADGDIIANHQRVASGVVIARVCDVQHRAVLHAGARTYADAVHIAANHHTGPDGGVIAQYHIANDDSGFIDKHART